MKKKSSRYVQVVIIVFILLCRFSFSLMAQSSVSQSIKFIFREAAGIFMPPELYIDIDFIDDNDNKILEAGENGVIKIIISNKGADANNVHASLFLEHAVEGLSINANEFIVNVLKDSNFELLIPVVASNYLPTDSVSVNILINEPLGYNISAKMLLSTYEYPRPEVVIQGVRIVDSGKGLRAYENSPDGKLQKGEVAMAFVTLQNIGNSASNVIKYSIQSKDADMLLMNDDGVVDSLTGEVENLLVGETRDIPIRLSPNNKYAIGLGYIPVFLSLEIVDFEKRTLTYQLPLQMNTKPDKPKVVNIEPDFDKLLALRKTEVFSSSNRISSNIKTRDISQAPVGEPLYKDAIAIVMGVEKNGYDIAPAPYAARDAKVMSNFFTTTLGIKDVRMLTDSEVTKSRLSDIFDKGGELERVVNDSTDVFVFYSGHGVPDNNSDNGEQDVYLLPFDGRKDMINERGYSLTRLYDNLNLLGAKSVTVILDACFSGASRQSVSYPTLSIGNTKGIVLVVQNMASKPWEENPNFRVITSSTGSQTSLGYDQSQSGLFTYYLAVGMQGDADKNGDGTIMLGELMDYVSSEVSSTAKSIRNGSQTPQLFGNTEMIIEKIK